MTENEFYRFADHTGQCVFNILCNRTVAYSIPAQTALWTDDSGHRSGMAQIQAGNPHHGRVDDGHWSDCAGRLGYPAPVGKRDCRCLRGRQLLSVRRCADGAGLWTAWLSGRLHQSGQKTQSGSKSRAEDAGSAAGGSALPGSGVHLCTTHHLVDSLCRGV